MKKRFQVEMNDEESVVRTSVRVLSGALGYGLRPKLAIHIMQSRNYPYCTTYVVSAVSLSNSR